MTGRQFSTVSAPAYADRIRGDMAENLEKAIKAYEAALSVFTREAFPLGGDAERSRDRLRRPHPAATRQKIWKRRSRPTRRR